MVEFRWDDWNLEHATQHGVGPQEAQRVVLAARSPYPLYRGDEKWLVWGRGNGGQPLQVVFVIDADDWVYIIHARPLTEREKKRFRKQR